jgi:hypothetical protein
MLLPYDLTEWIPEDDIVRTPEWELVSCAYNLKRLANLMRT